MCGDFLMRLGVRGWGLGVRGSVFGILRSLAPSPRPLIPSPCSLIPNPQSLFLLLIATFALLPSITQAADYGGRTADGWREGRDFTQQLAAPLSGTWAQVPLKELTAGLARTQNVAIVLDRRVDPQQPLTLDVADMPMAEALGKVAAERKLEIIYLGPIVYLAPAGEAAGLEAVFKSRRDELRALPASVARRWRSAKTMAWEDLTAPAELVAVLCAEGGFSVTNPDRLPHDLWAAADLPKLALVDRVSFILGQFGLTFEMLPAGKNGALQKGAAIKLVPIPDVPNDNVAQKTKSPTKYHKKPARPAAGNKELRIERFNVSQAPLEPLLQQIASRLGLTLELDREKITASGIRLDQPVSISATGVTIDELFEKILKPLGLSAEREDKAIRIGPIQ